MLSSSNIYWTAVEQNLWMEQINRGLLAKILGREEEYRRMAGRFYVVVVQEVLLFGSKKWVLIPRLEKALEGFHHRSMRRMAGMGPKSCWYVTWVYTPIGVALVIGALEDIGVFISLHQNTVSQYISTCLIMNLCLALERKMGMCRSRR